MKRLYHVAAAMIALCAAAAQAQPTVQATGGFVPQQAVAFGATGAGATGVDAAHPLPVVAQAAAATYTDRSGAITTSGAAQTIAVARADRRGFFLQNLSTGDLWINFAATATAAAPSIRVAAGQLYESPAHGIPAGAISVLGGTAGQSFTAKEW